MAMHWTIHSFNMFYLDPREKDSNGNHVIELCLPKAKRVKVRVLLVVGQQSLQQFTHSDRTVQVKHNCHVSQENYNNIQNIPEALEVLESVLLNLQDLFNGVVNYEEDKDSLARHHKVIQSVDITNQFHCAKIERRNATSSGRVFKQQSGERHIHKNDWMSLFLPEIIQVTNSRKDLFIEIQGGVSPIQLYNRHGEELPYVICYYCFFFVLFQSL